MTEAISNNNSDTIDEIISTINTILLSCLFASLLFGYFASWIVSLILGEGYKTFPVFIALFGSLMVFVISGGHRIIDFKFSCLKLSSVIGLACLVSVIIFLPQSLLLSIFLLVCWACIADSVDNLADSKLPAYY